MVAGIVVFLTDGPALLTPFRFVSTVFRGRLLVHCRCCACLLFTGRFMQAL